MLSTPLQIDIQGALKQGFSRLDDRQIAHLVCVRLKHLLYDFFGCVLGPPSCCFSYIKGPKHPLKSHTARVLGGHRLDE